MLYLNSQLNGICFTYHQCNIDMVDYIVEDFLSNLKQNTSKEICLNPPR